MVGGVEGRVELVGGILNAGIMLRSCKKIHSDSFGRAAHWLMILMFSGQEGQSWLSPDETDENRAKGGSSDELDRALRH